MGNCLKPESRQQWGGEDWGPALAAPATKPGPAKPVCSGPNNNYSDSKRVVCKEVKVKITKKQLEELVGMVDVKGMTVEQLLEQLMKASDRYESQRKMTSAGWKPKLQSIPELKSFRSLGRSAE